MKSRRILVGTTEVAGMLVDLAAGFRRLGHSVTSVVTERHSFYPDARYDVDLTWSGKPTPTTRTSPRLLQAISRRARIVSLLASHDVFVFLWGGVSLTNGNLEYPLIRAAGKRLVSIFVGDDVRYRPLFAVRYGDLPPAFVGEHGGGDQLLQRLRALRTGERWANVILSQPNQAGLALRPYMHLFVPLDLSDYRFTFPAREVPVVVHAPSSMATKGSAQILAALERLRAEGLRFELRLLQNMAHADVRRALADADVAVDQLYLPLHGKFGIEAMASGCALASCNRQDAEPYPPERPVWHIDQHNVGGQLRRLLEDGTLRARLATQGRAYVERYHDHVAVAERIVRLATEPIDHYDHRPTFSMDQLSVAEIEGLPRSLRR